MIPYGILAEYYDELMAGVDYGARADYLLRIFERHRLSPGLVLDAACGTGSLTLALARRGLEMIGADRSPQMLSKAAGKAGSVSGRALFICQDMRNLDLYGTVDAAVCSLDGINHLTCPQSLEKALGRIALFLNPGGLFVFDLNTPYKMTHVLHDHTFMYDTERVCCIWQSSMSARAGLCHFALTFFERQGDLYRRSDENFSERAYSTRSIRHHLAQAGLELVGVYDDLSFDEPEKTAQRIVYVAKKPG